MSDQLPTTELEKDPDWTVQFVKLLDDRLAELEAGTSSEEALQKILESLVAYVEADTGLISRVRTGTDLLEPANTVTLAELDGSIKWHESLQQLTRLVGQEQRAHLIQDYPKWAGLSQPGTGPRCALAAPLLLAGRLEGVLTLASKRSVTAFTETDLHVAGLFARLAALTVQAGHQQKLIERLTVTDSLTGVWTRSQFLERAELAFRQALRYQRPLSAILIDIDRFKMLNEMHGYAAGDQVLGTVARNILSRLRDPDLLGRYGGDVFVLLLPETDLEHARLAAERMRTQIAAAPTETPKGTFFVTISAGVASLESGPIDQLDRLLDLADQATLAAKLAGRNQVASYSQELES